MLKEKNAFLWFINKLKSLSFLEGFTLLVSLSAIIMSSVPIYYQFFWSEEKLQFTVTDLNYDYEQKKINIEMAFINTGTESFFISSLELKAMNGINNGATILGEMKDILERENESFVIYSNDILIKKLSIKLSDNDISRFTTKECLPSNLIINIVVVSNKGKHLSNDTHIATFKSGTEDSYVQYFRDFVSLLDSDGVLRGEAEHYSVKGFSTMRNTSSNDMCSF